MHSYKQEFKEVDKILTKAKKNFKNDKQIGLYHAHIKASLGKLEDAAKLFSDLLIANPDDEQVLSSAAEFYFEVGRKDVASSLYESLKEINPKRLDYWIQKGLIDLEFGDITKAAANFIFVAEQKKNEDSFKGHFQLGKLYKMTGQIKKAAFAYKNCGDVFEGCILELAKINWVMGKKKTVLNSLEKFLSKKPRSMRTLATLADLYYSQGMFDEAGATLEKIERLDPSNQSVTRRLAQLMVKKGNYLGALERYQMLVNSKNVDEKDRINLANIYILTKEYESAFDQLDYVDRKSTYYNDLIITKYRLFMLNEGPKVAHKYILKEYKKSGYEQAGYILTKSYMQLNEFKKAGDTITKVVKKSPAFTNGLYLKGLIFFELGRKDEAITAFERVIALDENMAQALNFIAYHLAEENKDLKRAESLALKACEIAPDEAHFIDTLGFVYLKKKEFKQSIKLLKKAHELLPEEPIIAEHLADAYYENGDKNKAMQVYLLALPSLKGDNLARVGGKIARIKSIRKLSSTSER